MQKMKHLQIRDMTYIAACSALMAVCSWIFIPLPVPVTLQTFAMFVAAGLLGPRRGMIAVGIYVLLGAVGLPVFSGFKGGLGVLAGATGGYIVGFLLAVPLIGFLIKIGGKRPLNMAIAMATGLILCYIVGTAWFVFAYSDAYGKTSLLAVLNMCVFPFILPDVLKIALAIVIVKRLEKFVPGLSANKNTT